MIFQRSDTELDAVSQFMPESFLGKRRQRGVAGRRMRLSAWREPVFASTMPGILDWNSGGNVRAVARAKNLRGLGALGQDFPTDTSGAFDWNALIETAGQAYATYSQAELQRDLTALNLQRANQGLPLISPASVAPQANIGIAADTQKTLLMLGLGMAAILGGAYAFGVIGKGKRRRR